MSPARLALATAWLLVAVATAVVHGRIELALLLLAGVLATEALATQDDIGAPTPAGVLVPAGMLLLGWPWGLMIALGSVVVGDAISRRLELRLLLWQGALLTAMAAAGAWFIGVPGTVPPPAFAGRIVGGTWCIIYATWAIRRLASPGRFTAIVQAAAMVGATVAMLSAVAWLPALPGSSDGWVRAGLRGLAFAAAFMFVDFVGASLAALRAGPRHGLDFWLEHLPVLFARYGAQGIAAGLIVRWYATAGVGAVAAALVLLVVLQAALRLYRRAQETLDSAIAALASAIDVRDPYTAGHSGRVAEYAAAAAVHLGWSKAKVARTATAGLLHDIGKLGVADDVLHKPGALSEAEFDHMKRHAAAGEEIVAQVRGLSRIAAIVGQDHERWAGGGYPRGLAGGEILPEARLIAVADVFDAMTTDRPYRPALTEDAALRHLESVAGSQLDPALTASFIDLVRRPRPSGVAFCYCATH